MNWIKKLARVIRNDASEKIEITLTSAQLVSVTETQWPEIAIAKVTRQEWEKDSTWGWDVVRSWRAWLHVRQHKNGRAIVYGSAHHATGWCEKTKDEKEYKVYAGVLTEPNANLETAINDVAGTLAELIGDDLDTGKLVRRCLAALARHRMTRILGGNVEES
jgi:hypothetical protein